VKKTGWYLHDGRRCSQELKRDDKLTIETQRPWEKNFIDLNAETRPPNEKSR
jgi:hypothetical protein